MINSHHQPLNGYNLGALLFFYYNPKYLDCIGVLFFEDMFTFFRLFHVSEKSTQSGDSNHAEVVNVAKIRVSLGRDVFQTTFKVESTICD